MPVGQSIPASAIVAVTPGVLSPGGTGLAMVGLFLTASLQPPIGSVQSFPTLAAVEQYFGPSAPESAAAAVYFSGFDNSPIKPANLLFAQYPWAAAVPAYVRGGQGLTLAEIQAVTSGTITIVINGVSHTSSTIDLSGASSQSIAAADITSALGANDCTFTGAISGTTLTASVIATGALAVGQIIAGSGVTAGTTIVSGSGLSWVVNHSQSVASEAMTAGAAVVTWNSVSQAFEITGGTPGSTSTIAFPTGAPAVTLLLTAAGGAVLSQGANVATPAAFMTALTMSFTDFVSFSTIFLPSTNDQVAFAAWTSGQNSRYGYIMSYTDAAPTTNTDTTSANYLIRQADYSGTMTQYDPNLTWKNAFLMSVPASTDFTALNGRYTFAFRSQAGLTADVNSQTVAANLIANGSNYYGAYATAAQGFVFEYPGQITGIFKWADSYFNQIWLNSNLQLAGMTLLTTVPSIPFNGAGQALIAAALADPISAAVNFGAIRAGVTLSALQISEVNSAAGLDISGPLFQQGYYLQIKIPSSTVRVARGPWPVTLWYCDGQSVQSIDINSIDIL